MRKTLTLDEVTAAQALADLLAEAAPLIDHLSSPHSSPDSRELLRSLVGADDLVGLAVNLTMMSTPQLWNAAHPPHGLSPELAERIRRLDIE